jgi:sulfite exporter TauE/SafE
MCGPLTSGLRLEEGVGSRFRGLIAYQFGRLILYSILGGAAGWFGAESITVDPKFGWLIVIFIFLMAISKFLHLDQRFSSLDGFVRVLGRILSKCSGPFRPFFLGVLMSFLPCMLVVWALTLAAQTQSFIAGIGIMACLVVLSSFPLLMVLQGSSVLSSRFRFRLEPYLLLFSALWSGLIVGASNNLFSHLSFSLRLFGRVYEVMFW